MTLRRYFKPVDQTADGLPDPHRPLSARIPAATIAAANDAVRDAIAEETRKSRGKYVIYTPTVHLEIAKYACNHGIESVARVFSRKLKQNVSESTVCSMRNAYRQERSAEDDAMSVLPSKKRGRHLLLGFPNCSFPDIFIYTVYDIHGYRDLSGTAKLFLPFSLTKFSLRSNFRGR